MFWRALFKMSSLNSLNLMLPCSHTAGYKLLYMIHSKCLFLALHFLTCRPTPHSPTEDLLLHIHLFAGLQSVDAHTVSMFFCHDLDVFSLTAHIFRIFLSFCVKAPFLCLLLCGVCTMQEKVT